MKKCASCTKDLPDAALHCVFCGAKQAPAPASSPAIAKTVMGYGGNAELDALRAQAASQVAARQPAPSAPAHVPAAAPFAPRANPSQPPPGAGMAPGSAASAATMFVPGGGGQAPMGPGPGQRPMGPGPMGPGPGPMGPGPGPMGPGPGPMPAGAYGAPVGPAPIQHAPIQPAPIQPIAPSPQYQSANTPARAGRPIEPWKDTLRLILLVWGGLLLAAFATPLTLDPLAFNWDIIINGEGTAKLMPLILAAVGVLSIVIALVPLTAPARGGLGLALGLAGVLVPLALLLVDAAGAFPVEILIMLIGHIVGMLLLVPSLLARSEYREAMLPRVLITVGALLALLPMLMPVGGEIGLVAVFTMVIDAEGAGKVVALIALANVVLIVLSLLAWLPSPASGGAKPLAWLLIGWGLVTHAATLFLVGDPSMIEATPYAGAMSWVAGGAGTGGAAGGLGVAYLAIVAYCGATVLGKQLE